MLVRAVISGRSCVKLNELGGAVAQLGARLDGIEEVVGSNPIGSTNFTRTYPRKPLTVTKYCCTVASFAFSSCVQG
jgi:hypothetical protein